MHQAHYTYVCFVFASLSHYHESMISTVSIKLGKNTGIQLQSVLHKIMFFRAAGEHLVVKGKCNTCPAISGLEF